MTDAERAEFRTLLLSLRDELEAFVSASAGQSRPVSLDEPIGRLSRVDAMQQQQMVDAQRQLAATRLRAVAAAMARLDDDRFGECAACGEEIDRRRLRVRPESAVCLACQQQREG